MFSLPLIFLIFGTPVACLTVGAVIVIPGCNRSSIRVFLVFIFMVCLGQIQPDGAHPSLGCLYWPQPKSTITVWLALVTNTWPLTQRVLPPWPLTSSRKTSAQWCCVITTPNGPIGLGDSWRWERLISSQQVIDLSTALCSAALIQDLLAKSTPFQSLILSSLLLTVYLFFFFCQTSLILLFLEHGQECIILTSVFEHPH